MNYFDQASLFMCTLERWGVYSQNENAKRKPDKKPGILRQLDTGQSQVDIAKALERYL